MGHKKCKNSCCIFVPVQGPPGPPGPPGPSGTTSSTIIPFSSTAINSENIPVIEARGISLGFGSQTAGDAPLFFVMPHDGTITQLNTELVAYIEGITITDPVVMTLTLFSAPAGSTVVTSTGLVSTITISATIPADTAVTGTVATGSVFVPAGTKLSLIVSVTDTLTLDELGFIIIGAGINIEH